MANNDTHGSPRDITRLIVGLLFGSGISGLAIGMIQGDPAVRPWGMAVFVLCLIASGVLFWFGESVIERQGTRGLKRLGTAYSDTTEAILEKTLEYSSQPEDMSDDVFGILNNQIDKSHMEDAKAEWAKVFKQRTKHIIKEAKKKNKKLAQRI